MVKIAGSLVVIAGLVGCGDDGGKVVNKDAAIDSKTIDAPMIDAPMIDAPMIDAPPGTFQLTVKNYLAWCDVSVNGGASSTASTQNVFVLPGNIPLVAKAASGFIVAGNMWHDTLGDTTGDGETGAITMPGGVKTSSATAVVGSAAKCVWVCCPFPAGNGCDQAQIGDQCP